jgi:hypothetical protein
MRANTARRRVTLGLRSKITLLSRCEEFVVLRLTSNAVETASASKLGAPTYLSAKSRERAFDEAPDTLSALAEVVAPE